MFELSTRQGLTVKGRVQLAVATSLLLSGTCWATSQSEMIATLPLELPKSITCRGFPACAVTQSLTGRVATTG